MIQAAIANPEGQDGPCGFQATVTIVAAGKGAKSRAIGDGRVSG